jgi:hypothetical protein
LLRLERICSAPAGAPALPAAATLAAAPAKPAQSGAGPFASPRARRLAALVGFGLGIMALCLALDLGGLRAKLFAPASAESEKARLNAAFSRLSRGLGRHWGELAPERRAAMSSARPGHAPPPGSPAAPHVGPSDP